MLVYILFVIGFFALIKGADVLVKWSWSLAKKWWIPAIVIGLTIVAFGTSMPELVVNLFASASWATDLAIGNVIGSNIANIFLILWISAIIYPLVTQRNTSWKEIPFSLLAVILVGLLANDMMIDGNTRYSGLTRIDGLVLLWVFCIFLVYVFQIVKKKENKEAEPEVKKLPVTRSVIYIVLGIAGLALGGKWIVDGAVHIATIFGVSQSLIGLTIVAIWTSLPEVATSGMAAYRKQTDIAIGNIVGSNIFNVFWVLGLSATIRPLPFDMSNNVNVWVMIWATVVLFLILFIGKKHVIQRWQGRLFVSLYIAYMAFLIFTA